MEYLVTKKKRNSNHETHLGSNVNSESLDSSNYIGANIRQNQFIN